MSLHLIRCDCLFLNDSCRIAVVSPGFLSCFRWFPDRFLLQVRVDYPARDAELEILQLVRDNRLQDRPLEAGSGPHISREQLFQARLGHADIVMLVRVEQVWGKGRYQGRQDQFLEIEQREERFERAVTALSIGQQQRVAVARAIVSEPALVLADEPTANLDSKTAIDLIQLMRKLNEEHGITFVFSTHDIRVMERARRLIAEEHPGLVHERAGNCDSLLFTAGELGRAMAESVTETHGRDYLVEPVPLRTAAGQIQGKGDVLGGAQGGHEVEGLVHEPDMLAAEQRPVTLREARQVDAGNHDAAGIRGVDAADEIQQGRFAGSAASAHGNRLATQEVRADVVQHEVPAPPFGERLAEMPKLDLDLRVHFAAAPSFAYVPYRAERTISI